MRQYRKLPKKTARANLNFDLTTKEFEQINWIARRIERMVSVMVNIDAQQVHMDITVTHKNGCPLDLDSLWKAPDKEFLFDVLGIIGSLDKNTGKLDGFSPVFKL